MGCHDDPFIDQRIEAKFANTWLFFNWSLVDGVTSAILAVVIANDATIGHREIGAENVRIESFGLAHNGTTVPM
jgi:hypothetical protein